MEFLRQRNRRLHLPLRKEEKDLNIQDRCIIRTFFLQLLQKLLCTPKIICMQIALL